MNESDRIFEKMTALDAKVNDLSIAITKIKLRYEHRTRIISIISGSIGTIFGTIVGIIIDRLSK